jgi:hypothetical protein
MSLVMQGGNLVLTVPWIWLIGLVVVLILLRALGVTRR